MEVRIEGNNLLVSIPIEQRPSSSGKTVLVASTSGNKRTGVQVDGRELYLSLNAYYYPEDKKR